MEAKAASGNKISVYAAIAANIAVGIVKFIAAGISGSSAMVSEGIHSVVDSGNGLLVLLGLRRSKRPATIEHPFGFGKELYFWTLVVAVSVFMLGGLASIFQGARAMSEALRGVPFDGDPTLSFVVLGIAAVLEGSSLAVALRQFNAARGSRGVMDYIEDCKDPTLYTVVLEDSAAELGLVFAAVGLALTVLTGSPVFDAVASECIGALLIAASAVMLHQSKDLLLGEGMTRDELGRARAIVESDEAVREAGGILTMYFGPASLLMTADVTFEEGVTANGALLAVDRIERELKREFPQMHRIYIEAENLASVERQRIEQSEMPDE